MAGCSSKTAFCGEPHQDYFHISFPVLSFQTLQIIYSLDFILFLSHISCLIWSVFNLKYL